MPRRKHKARADRRYRPLTPPLVRINGQYRPKGDNLRRVSLSSDMAYLDVLIK
jgi:hypothetical protein